MRTKSFALIAVALVVLIACIAVPVLADESYISYNGETYLYSSGYQQAPLYISVYGNSGVYTAIADGVIQRVPWIKRTSGYIHFGLQTGDTTTTQFGDIKYPWGYVYQNNPSATGNISLGSFMTRLYSTPGFYISSVTCTPDTACSNYLQGTDNVLIGIPDDYFSTTGNWRWFYIADTPIEDYIPPAPVASFNATPASGNPPLSVVFTDTSSSRFGGNITSWQWNFGDGAGAYTQNASHVYTTKGSYNVSLTVGNIGGSSTAYKTITVSQDSRYYQVVDIVDATSGSMIAAANLSSGIVDSGQYHNWSGSYGEFNITGTGSDGTTAIEYGDKLDLQGSAPNYCPNSKTKVVDIPGADSVPTSLALAPLYLTPKSGELTLILDVSNATSGAPIYFAKVTLNNPSKTVIANTNPQGVVTFANLSASETHQITVTYQGYADASKTVYAPTGGILYQSVELTPVGSSYFWPVTIVDTSGTVILNSELDVTRADADQWYNRTSATGKFNVTGMGTDGTEAIPLGLAIILQGKADGYVTNGYAIKMSESNKGVTQYVTLTPNGRVPISGEFSSVYSVYDHDTTDPVYYVKITQVCTNSTKIGYTSPAGSLQFTNMTVGDSCTYTVSKTGYSTATGSFTVTTSGLIKQVDVALSKSSVNPTVTVTIAAPTVNPTATGAEGAQNAIDLLGSYAYTFMVLGIFSVFMWLFWSVIYNMTGGNIITKILKRGRR